MDPGRNRYPYCLVFGPLPVITWILPFIGHMGIGDSNGRIHDFASSFYIGIDEFMVGKVARYYRIDPRTCEFPNRHPEMSIDKAWDEAIQLADDQFCSLKHNLVTQNCHHHAARAMQFMGKSWTMLYCWYLITFHASFVSVGAIVRTYAGFLTIATIVVLLSIVL